MNKNSGWKMVEYPTDYIKQVILRDGTRVLLRPIRQEDAPLLQEGFSRLSQNSIYLRFLESLYELSDEQARKLANVDYLERMAIVGSIKEGGEERLVVVARYAQIEEPGVAEVAIVVRDDFQGRCLGMESMKHLINYAKEHGIHTLRGSILMNNHRVLRFIEKSNFPYEKRMLEPGTWEISIRVDGKIS